MSRSNRIVSANDMFMMQEPINHVHGYRLKKSVLTNSAGTATITIYRCGPKVTRIDIYDDTKEDK